MNYDALADPTMTVEYYIEDYDPWGEPTKMRREVFVPGDVICVEFKSPTGPRNRKIETVRSVSSYEVVTTAGRRLAFNAWKIELA